MQIEKRKIVRERKKTFLSSPRLAKREQNNFEIVSIFSILVTIKSRTLACLIQTPTSISINREQWTVSMSRTSKDFQTVYEGEI